MKKDSVDFKFCINLAIDNAEKRIKLLEERDQKCILEEYKEWLKETIDYQSILLPVSYTHLTLPTTPYV